MTFAFRPPTETEMAAVKRRRAFHESIAAKADELKAAKMRAAVETLGTPIAPEAMPAEPDPPAVPPCQCPLCGSNVLRAVVEAGERPYPPISAIQAVVASYYNVSRGDLCSARRSANVVRPRQIAMYISKEMTPFSLPAIGRRFGGRDHTTVLHAVRKISAMIFADASFALEVVGLIERAGLQPAP